MSNDALIDAFDSESRSIARVIARKHRMIEAEVEDVLSATRFRLMNSNSSVAPEARKSYVWRTAFNVAIDQVRSPYRNRRLKGSRRSTDWDGGLPMEQSNDGGIGAAEDRVYVSAILEQIPAHYRTVLLTFADGYSSRDGAAALGLSTPAYKSRLCRGLRMAEQLAGGAK